MGYSKAVAERVRSILARRPDVVERRMIGGLSFMVSDNMCCGVMGDDLMVRLGPAAYEWAIAQSHMRRMEFAGRPLKSFVRVDLGGFQTEAELAAWIQRGIDCVATLPAKTAPARKQPQER